MDDPMRTTPMPGRAIDEQDILEKSRDVTTNVTTSSALIIPANKHRTGVFLTNDSDTVIYLGIGHAAAVNAGIRLNAAGGAFEVNKANMFKGDIYAIHDGVGNKVLCGEEIETRYAY